LAAAIVFFVLRLPLSFLIVASRRVRLVEASARSGSGDEGGTVLQRQCVHTRRVDGEQTTAGSRSRVRHAQDSHSVCVRSVVMATVVADVQ
jgi:hypothetical protein